MYTGDCSVIVEVFCNVFQHFSSFKFFDPISACSPLNVIYRQMYNPSCHPLPKNTQRNNIHSWPRTEGTYMRGWEGKGFPSQRVW